MTHAIDAGLLPERALPPRVLPDVPPWVVSRPRAAEQLELGVSGLLTLVTAPTGWGKTQAVAEWATDAQLPGALIWLNVAGAAADPDVFWLLLRDALVEAGEKRSVPIPDVGSHERRRTHALTMLGASLRRSGPWVVVLDDFPSGQVGQLGRDLEVVLERAIRGLRLVILSHGEPAIEIQRHHVAGQLTRVAASELAMDVPEVTEVLARHEVDATDLTARLVQRHSHGWPCGVRLAALALKGASTTEAAMELADRGAVDYLASEVLAKAPDRVRDLIVRTSMVDEVSRELATAVLGVTDVALDPAEASEAFLELRSDGSFTCDPLIRAAALVQLAREPEGVAAEARRRAADWYVARGDVPGGSRTGDGCAGLAAGGAHLGGVLRHPRDPDGLARRGRRVGARCRLGPGSRAPGPGGGLPAATGMSRKRKPLLPRATTTLPTGPATMARRISRGLRRHRRRPTEGRRGVGAGAGGRGQRADHAGAGPARRAVDDAGCPRGCLGAVPRWHPSGGSRVPARECRCAAGERVRRRLRLPRAACPARGLPGGAARCREACRTRVEERRCGRTRARAPGDGVGPPRTRGADTGPPASRPRRRGVREPGRSVVRARAAARGGSAAQDDQRARGRAEAAAPGVERGAGRRSVGMAGRPADPRLCRDAAGCGGAAPGPRPGDCAATRCGSRGRSAGSVRALRARRCRSCFRCAGLGGWRPRGSSARRAGRLLDARGAAGARGRTAGPGARPGGPRAANCRRGDASTTVRPQRDVAGRRSSRRTRRCAGHTVVSSPGSGLRRSATRRG